MIKRLLYGLGLVALLLIVAAQTNLLYNKNILTEPPDFYLIFLASACLLLVLLMWPVSRHNKTLKAITVSLKIVVIAALLLLMFAELAIMDFAGMALGREVMYHFNLDAFILGVKEYKYTLILVVVIIVLVAWFVELAAQNFRQKTQWWVFSMGLLGLIIWGDLTIVGRAYKAVNDFYSEYQIKSMTAKELEKFAYLGIQPILTDKSNIEITSSNHKNLIVIYLESFSQIFTESKAYPDLTPNLNKLKQQHQALSPYISSAGFTLDGLIASMCGFIPNMRMGNNTLATQQGTYSALPCYPDVLHKAGYVQEFFGGAKKEFAGKSAFLLSHGFDRVVGWEDFVDLPEYASKDSHNWWGLYDDDLFNRVFNRVTELHQDKEPFHLQLLTIGTHLKGFPAPDCEPYSEISHSYINAIHCTDQLVGHFVERLEATGILEDTVVYITGDHTVFNSTLSRELFGKQVDNRNLYGVIIDKDPLATVHVEALYDLAPAVLQSVGVAHNLQFVLGRANAIKDRLILTRGGIYQGGQALDLSSSCDELTSLAQQLITSCALKSSLKAITAHTLIYSTTEGLLVNAESNLEIVYNTNLSTIEAIKLDDAEIKSHFRRDGFEVKDKYYSGPGLFYVGINKESRAADRFVFIRADKNPQDILARIKEDYHQPFVVFGAFNVENKSIMSDFKAEYALECMFDIVCFSHLTNVAVQDILDQPVVKIGIKALLDSD